MNQKSLYLTLDYEADPTTATSDKTYAALKQADRLAEFLSSNDLPLTVFCEGEILEHRFERLRPLIDAGAEIELHAYDHSTAFAEADARTENFLAGLAVYRERFGTTPRGYRAPYGMIAFEEMKRLAEEGLQYDSSIFPTKFPGRFDFSFCPREPFLFSGLPIVELPISTMGPLRIPVALSYYQLIGPTPFRLLFSLFGGTEDLVFDFHMHDIIRGDWLKDKNVPLSFKLGYFRAQSMKDPFSALTGAVRMFRKRGYEPKPLSALYEKARSRTLKEVTPSW